MGYQNGIDTKLIDIKHADHNSSGNSSCMIIYQYNNKTPILEDVFDRLFPGDCDLECDLER